MGVLFLISLPFLIPLADTDSAQTPPPQIIRPSLPTNQSPTGDFLYPGNAWDANEDTSAAGVWERSCAALCTGTTTKTTTWSGFPAGHRPEKLFVRRRLWTVLSGVYKPDVGQIKVKIEWTAGDGWNLLEELTATKTTTCADNPDWCSQAKTVDLSPESNSGSIQVRVTVDISFLHCDGCDGPSNAMATVAVQDIKIETEPAAQTRMR